MTGSTEDLLKEVADEKKRMEELGEEEMVFTEDELEGGGGYREGRLGSRGEHQPVDADGTQKRGDYII